MPATKKKPSRFPRLRRSLNVGGALRNGLVTLGAVVALAGSFFLVDDRYAHAADTSRNMEMNRLAVEISVLQLRKSALEDRVYDTAARVASRQRLSPPEAASYERYKAELAAIASEIAAKARQLERVRTGR